MRIVKMLFLLLLVSSCQFFNKVDTEEAVARVNDVYLYKADIKNSIPPNATAQDSTQLVSNYITNWATNQLLMQGATINLSDKQQATFNALIEQYKNDLYSKAYLEALVHKNLDTVVTFQQADKYYQGNQEVFKLKEELIKFRYINLDKNRIDNNGIITKFKRFNQADKTELDSIAIQFKNYSLNDSIWIRFNQAVSKIPVFNDKNQNELLKKSNFIQIKDSLGLYLVQIKDVLERNDTAPLEYVKPTIDQIVINRRKLELIKQLKKDITKDAIKNKQFELYD